MTELKWWLICGLVFVNFFTWLDYHRPRLRTEWVLLSTTILINVVVLVYILCY